MFESSGLTANNSERLQKKIANNPNIQRVVSIEKKFGTGSGDLSLGTSELRQTEEIAEINEEEFKETQENIPGIKEEANYEDIEAYIRQKYSNYLREDGAVGSYNPVPSYNYNSYEKSDEKE